MPRPCRNPSVRAPRGPGRGSGAESPAVTEDGGEAEERPRFAVWGGRMNLPEAGGTAMSTARQASSQRRHAHDAASQFTCGNVGSNEPPNHHEQSRELTNCVDLRSYPVAETAAVRGPQDACSRLGDTGASRVPWATAGRGGARAPRRARAMRATRSARRGRAREQRKQLVGDVQRRQHRQPAASRRSACRRRPTRIFSST